MPKASDPWRVQVKDITMRLKPALDARDLKYAAYKLLIWTTFVINIFLAQSTGAVESTDYFSAEK